MPAAEVEQPPKCKVKNTRALIFHALYAFMVHAYDIDNYILLPFILPDFANHTRYSKFTDWI
jgi:hypothetical protein